MPSPRAVLCDIHDLKLDPTKAHRGVKASGRLAALGSAAAAEPEVPKPEKPPKPALVELPTKNDELEVSQAEIVTELAVDAEPTAKKPSRPGKKKEEKKSEEQPAS